MNVAQLKQSIWQHKPELYFEHCLKIRDKLSQQNVAFTLNRNQQRVQDAVNKQRRTGKPVRILVLKYRQGGISTISASNIFHQCRFVGGTNMVVSLDLDSAEHLFSIYQRFYHYLPKSEQAILRAVASSRKELKFEEPHGGRIIVETAGKTAAGHSYTITGLHLSEVSRWPEGTDDARAGLLNSVADSPNTIIIIESVANGMSGWFYDEWHKQDSAYAKVFLPWYDQPEYVMPLPVPNYEPTLTEEERRFIADYGLSLEQVEWRRHTIHNKLDDDAEKFKEQYPATPREAFLASGNAFFHSATLDAIVTSDPLRAELRVLEDPSHQTELRAVPVPNGRLRIWRRPQRSSQYVIGCDVAEGIEIEGAPPSDRHDYSSADVIDRNTGEQVAQLHGKMTPDEFGRQLDLLGEFFNWAYIGVESNAGYGLHVIDTLRTEGYPEHLLHRQQVLDEATRKMTTKLGWRTTMANRRQLMSSLDMSVRRHDLHLNSEETINEMRAFVTKPNGRLEAGTGKKDDRVFSLAIANQMLPAAPANMQLGSAPQPGNEPTSYRPSRNIYANRVAAR